MSYFVPALLETATNIYQGTAYHLALGFRLPNPNAHSCDRLYGRPPPSNCHLALNSLPSGDLPTIFTTRPHQPGNNYVTLPQRYADSGQRPSCVVTIDLDGQSSKDVFVNVPWDAIRNITSSIINMCVEDRSMGGWETFGLEQAFNALIDPAFLPPDAQNAPVGVQDPDETVSSVGFPEGSNRNSPLLNIPSYMLVTVSSPRSRASRDQTDFSISLNLREYLKQKFESSQKHSTQDAIARASKALSHGFVSSLMTYDHPRWWQFQLGPPTPEPLNVDYSCDAKLGNPGIGGCETLLYEFIREGNVVLDPSTGPLIKTAGNCAIGILSQARQVTSWDMLRSVAETLVLTCVASPIAAAAGGTAVTKPTRSGRRRRSSSSFPFPKRDTAPTPLPPSIEISVYLQPPFPGAADQTCPWKVASSHKGDVRQCALPSSPFRPPERKLLASNGTVIRDGNITEVVNATAVEFSSGKVTEVLVGDMTGLLADLASTSGAATRTGSMLSISSSLPSRNTSLPASAAATSASLSSFTLLAQQSPFICVGGGCPVPTAL
ncbi:MAG: hypothetical protein HETSPECPRED_002497 [Heterodermia speciosa]|uniref:Uncharacterized protein n=1 Tax=Heterodermia speciosa TaxID=116794 RepID=A0A8H3F1G7_9LECA|nr:MAG: hypothetical protein HETSPECPRED_002497 [Heterodermia speciosa]